MTILTDEEFIELQMCSTVLKVINNKLLEELKSKDILALLELQRHLLECVISLVEDNE